MNMNVFDVEVRPSSPRMTVAKKLPPLTRAMPATISRSARITPAAEAAMPARLTRFLPRDG